MALKQLAHKPPAPLPAAPIWGIVAGEDETPLVLRLEWADRTESLPYHTLTRWTLEVGSEDVLTLHAARLVLTIRGRALAPVREALDSGRLVSVRATEVRYLPLKSGTLVTGITVSSGDDS
ncbi:MAG: hypothetical protein RL091_739 [Verrucomicrobiota bacterium]|jgi:hypothetical protein